MSMPTQGLTKPVMVFFLGIASLIISGLVWSNVSMASAWAKTINSQTVQNSKDIAALREEYRVINTKLDALTELLKDHMQRSK